jgi:hypothetical protein
MENQMMADKNHFSQWAMTHIPFVTLLATEEVEKRPLLTRAIENGIVALVSGAFAAYVTLHTVQAVHNSQIEDLQRIIQMEHQDSLQQFQILQAQITQLQANQVSRMR